VENFSSERIGRFQIDPGELQRLAVRDRTVAIGALKENRIGGCDLVEFFAGEKAGRFPEGLDPAPSGNPRSRAALRRLLLHPGQDCAARSCFIKTRLGRPVADPENVTVRVGQSRHHRLSLEIDRSRGGAVKSICLSVRANEHDALTLGCDRIGLGGCVIGRINVAVNKNDVRRSGRLAFGPRRKDEGENERQNEMLHVQLGARFSRKAAIPSLASADSRASM